MTKDDEVKPTPEELQEAAARRAARVESLSTACELTGFGIVLGVLWFGVSPFAALTLLALALIFIGWVLGGGRLPQFENILRLVMVLRGPGRGDSR